MGEIDLSKAKPDGAAEIVKHFSDDVDALQESPEAIASELCALRERMRVDEAREKRLVAFFKSKKDRGAAMYGDVMVDVKEEKGRLTVDWKGYIKSEIREEAVSEAERAYGKQGDPIIKISVRRVSQGPQSKTDSEGY